MSLSIFLLWLVSIPLCIYAAAPPPTGFFIDCGASKEWNDDSIKWITDDGFIHVGEKKTIDKPDLLPSLSTLRFFPDKSARKYCYTFPVTKGGKYLVRTMYYYGGFDGGKEPPVFDQIIDGSKWSTVDTKAHYAKGLTSFYEVVVSAMGKTLSICLGRNEQTTSSPFISALQLLSLRNSMYNATDFTQYALGSVARGTFGDDKSISYPDDPFNRYWEAFTVAENPVVESHYNLSSEDFWDTPPASVFTKSFTASRGKPLQVDWPPVPLPNASYYIALYFQDNRTPSPYSWRVFNVTINGNDFYKDLNVSADGVSVYSANWPLSGQTKIVLTPENDSPVGPVISAAEIYQVFRLGGRTLTRDVIAMESLARSFDNPPVDWTGDPCLPENHSWTGVTCSGGKLARVVSLNLTHLGISGYISQSISNLTAISSILLDGNKLEGEIPDMSSLLQLVTLNLSYNQLTGKVPESLGHLEHLRELYLHDNKLEGPIPESLKKKFTDLQL
ncbi:probable LRR receptor-like serine/threonine-protein kinase At5g59680 [Aristolochia californica]|uniref:probable LRR receptor-like serine/threonine-protein kinase At5g59680 n=1 Tax=Aristolochia californica TaxID=171875 RepID=UPI0035D6F36F